MLYNLINALILQKYFVGLLKILFALSVAFTAIRTFGRTDILKGEIMAKLTQKENFLRVVRGEMPEYVPVSGAQGPLMTMFDSSVMGDFRGPKGGKDPWGVPFVTNEETGFAAIPEPNNFILKDITEWRDVIKLPPMEDIDWELAAQRDKDKLKINPENTLFTIGGYADLFQQFIGMMGFTEGLCALFESPEDAEELFDFMNQYCMYISKNILDYYKPEGYYLLDDSATQLQPFISVEMFERFFVPRYKKCLDMAVERDIPIFYHNCGRCEDLLPPMVEIGVNVWDPAQVENDLVAVKERFGRKLVINGGYEYRMPATWPNVDEEEVRQTVRDTFAKLAPNGGYVFSGRVKSMERNDPDVQRVNGWILDEAIKLSETMYK